MAVPITRHPTVPASTLADVKRIQKIVADTIRSYVGGNGMHSGMREKQVRCFRTVAVEVQNTGTATGTVPTGTSTAAEYPKYPSNVFAAEMGKPSFNAQPGLRRLVFTPYPGPVIRYLMDPFGNYRVEGEIVFAQLIHGQWYIIGGHHDVLFVAESNLIKESDVSATNLRRAHDIRSIPVANSSNIINQLSEWKGVEYTNSNNHSLRDSTPQTIYLCRSTPSQPITSIDEDRVSNADAYKESLDVIDVPLRNLGVVNRISIADDPATGSGLMHTVNYTIPGEYPWHVRPCHLLSFGGCGSEPGSTTPALNQAGFWSIGSFVIDVRLVGDAELSGLYDDYSVAGFADQALPSCAPPENTGTATSTSTASA